MPSRVWREQGLAPATPIGGTLPPTRSLQAYLVALEERLGEFVRELSASAAVAEGVADRRHQEMARQCCDAGRRRVEDAPPALAVGTRGKLQRQDSRVLHLAQREARLDVGDTGNAREGVLHEAFVVGEIASHDAQ